MSQSKVVRAGGDLTHGGPAQHQLVRAQAQEVREVGGAVRELENVERAIDAGEYLREAGA
jgi:hypothetical protein